MAPLGTLAETGPSVGAATLASLESVDAENRAEQFAEAVQSVRHWATPEIALQATGIRPETATPDELARLAEAEREAVDEAIGMIRKAARTDTLAADWLRSRGVSPDG